MKFDVNRWRPFFKEKAPWILFGFVGILLFIFRGPTDPPVPDPVAPMASVDTFIPQGHLLVPVDLRNADQLEGLLGPNSVVDLYQIDPQGHPNRLVGRRLRLLRAPLNPRVYAILIREKEAERLLSFPGPFNATLRNPQQEAHEIQPRNQGPEIEYQKEGS